MVRRVGIRARHRYLATGGGLYHVARCVGEVVGGQLAEPVVIARVRIVVLNELVGRLDHQSVVSQTLLEHGEAVDTRQLDGGGPPSPAFRQRRGLLRVEVSHHLYPTNYRESVWIVGRDHFASHAP